MKLKLVKEGTDYHLLSGIQMKKGDKGWCLTSDGRLFEHYENTIPMDGDILVLASTSFHTNPKENLLSLDAIEIQIHLDILNKNIDVEGLCIRKVLQKNKWQHLTEIPKRPFPNFFWNEVDNTIEGYNLAYHVNKKSWTDEDMIKASKYGYEFRDTTTFPEHKFEQACINNTKQWMQYLNEERTEWDIEVESENDDVNPRLYVSRRGYVKILNIS